MLEEVKLKSLIQPQSGVISLCCYCGEQVGNTQKFCPICKTKKGRESILEANKNILTEGRKLGFFPDKVMLPVA